MAYGEGLVCKQRPNVVTLMRSMRLYGMTYVHICSAVTLPDLRGRRSSATLSGPSLPRVVSYLFSSMCNVHVWALAQCRERLEKEIAEAAPPNSRVKVTSPANAIERRFSVWIGAT